jgi:glycosyltransferase involved in cell wall biosynthesis
MNVLLTHERFLPDFGGGGEPIVYETARHLRRRGVHVQVLTTGDPRLTSYEGVPTHRLPIHRYRLNGAVGPIVAAARSADLIHTCTYHAALPSLLAGKWLKKPVVCQVLGLFQEAWRQMRGTSSPLLIAWERFLVTRGFARTLFLSDYSRDLGVSLGVLPDRAIVNSPGIDLPKYGPASEKDHVVLFVGKLEARKGIDDLLDVAARLPEVRFRVIGWGPEADHVRRSAARNIEYLGFREGESLRAAFGRASIFFCPSKVETFGLVVAEAMASGCAIVTTIPLPVEGIHVPVADRDAMTAAIRCLWGDQRETERMGRANMELARVYTWERYTDVLLETYDEVMRERRGNPLSSRTPPIFSPGQG